MSGDRTLNLLVDLARLVKRYGPGPFEDLAALLREPEGTARLVSILEGSAQAGRDGTVMDKSRSTRKWLSPSLISDIRRNEPEKAEVLLGFAEALEAKSILPTLREVKDFASDNGLRPVTASSREKALPSLLRSLAARSTEEVEQLLNRYQPSCLGGDRTLDGWAGVILRKERPKNSE